MVTAVLTAAALLLAAGPAAAKYASVVMNAETGEILYAVNPDRRHYPASLTKMMTLYLVFEAVESGRLRMDDEITVSARAARQPPSGLGLRPGDRIRVRDVILGLAVKSANDAAAAIAETLGGTERKFAVLMSEKAAALGMTGTSFRNASGLPNRRQLTTARDIALLVQALRRDFPRHFGVLATRTFSYGSRTYDNHSRLLDRYDGTDAVKTGYIRASGFNLAASAERAGVRLIGVILGTRSPRARDLHMMGLLERGFEKATQGRYAAYDYDRNLRIDLKVLPTPRMKVVRVRGARGRIALARLTPPRRPAELAYLAGEGSTNESASEATDVAGGGAWGIQVGAFSRFAPAERTASEARDRLPSLLADTRVAVTAAVENGLTVYRARLMGLDAEGAANACDLFTAEEIACLTVPPDSGSPAPAP